MATNKASLMSSLMGEDTAEPEQDLFGEIPLEEPPAPPPSVTPQPMPAPAAPPAGQLIVDNPLDQAPVSQPNNNPLSMSMPAQPTQPPPAAPATKSSLLASSGLLGTVGNGGGGGGLFDEVDKEEEERQRVEEQRRQEEQQRLEAQRQLDEEQRKQEEERRRIAQEEQMMQTVNLNNSVAYPPQMQQPQMQQPQMQQPQMQQPQMQQMTNQVQNMSMSTPNPMSFAERSQMMAQQQNPMAASQYAPQQQPMYQQQQPQMQQQHLDPAGFYRPQPQQQHQSPMPVQPTTPGGAPTTYVYPPTSPNGMPPQQPGAAQSVMSSPSQMMSATSRLPQTPTPSATVGMHNSMGRSMMRRQIVQPTPFEPIYGQCQVSDPLLVQPPSLFNVVPPHWTYQVQTSLKEGGCWLVRRRFRHIVALEDRLRMECPGAILPPRPDKHATRAIEEASTMQSAEFAMQRCAEVQVYLNAVAHHPFAGKATSLKLFLALQDDMGTAWPEVSSNALTRFGAVSGAAVQNVTEQHMPWEANTQDALEDNAELLALASSEGIRMGAVTQAVPKLEGSITLLREQGECAGAVGMELGKCGKAIEAADRDLYVPMEVLSQGLLRHGRRQKRLALELSAAMNPFVSQYKMCKYEKLAFQDRRSSLQKRVKERGRADLRAQRLMSHQRQSYNQHTAMGELDRLERDASMSDEMASGALHHCDIIGQTLKSEVNRVAFERRTEWSKSMRVLCSALKEATAEQTSIWESTKESFLQAFPEYANAN